MVYNFFRHLLPVSCALCGLTATAELCPACAAALPRITTACTCCGLPLPVDTICGRCQYRAPLYRRCISPFLYQPPISQLIANFKYQGQLHHGRLLTAELLKLTHTDIDAIVPVPLHWRRRWSRGFNQAELIGDELSRALRVPLQPRWLKRLRPTPPQQSLSANERRKNLRGVFAVQKSLANLRIALVDDVVTTGATVSEISRQLLDAGAHSVEIWCLARTP